LQGADLQGLTRLVKQNAGSPLPRLPPPAEEAKNAGNVSFPQLHMATFSLITILQELFKTGNWEEAYAKCDIEYLLTHCQFIDLLGTDIAKLLKQR
jgi:hypothetical protein